MIFWVPSLGFEPRTSQYLSEHSSPEPRWLLIRARWKFAYLNLIHDTLLPHMVETWLLFPSLLVEACLQLDCFKKKQPSKKLQTKSLKLHVAPSMTISTELFDKHHSSIPEYSLKQDHAYIFHSKNTMYLRVSSIFFETSSKLEIWMFLETANKAWQTICSFCLLEGSLKVAFWGNIQLFWSNFGTFLETSLN